MFWKSCWKRRREHGRGKQRGRGLLVNRGDNGFFKLRQKDGNFYIDSGVPSNIAPAINSVYIPITSNNFSDYGNAFWEEGLIYENLRLFIILHLQLFLLLTYFIKISRNMLFMSTIAAIGFTSCCFLLARALRGDSH